MGLGVREAKEIGLYNEDLRAERGWLWEDGGGGVEGEWRFY